MKKVNPLVGCLAIAFLLYVITNLWYIWVPIALVVVAFVIFVSNRATKASKAEIKALATGLPPASGYVVFDLETTGLYPEEGNRIVQIAIITLDSNLSEVGRFQAILNPGRDVGPTEIHGITNAMVRFKPTFKALASELKEVFEGRTVIAHNVEFDVGFLLNEFAITSPQIIAPTFKKIDTLELAREYLVDSPNHKLGTVVNHLKIDITNSPGRGSHDALTDTWYCWQILLKIIQLNKLDVGKLSY